MRYTAIFYRYQADQKLSTANRLVMHVEFDHTDSCEDNQNLFQRIIDQSNKWLNDHYGFVLVYADGENKYLHYQNGNLDKLAQQLSADNVEVVII